MSWTYFQAFNANKCRIKKLIKFFTIRKHPNTVKE